MIWATGSQIADDGLEHLAGLIQLTHLGLSNTPTSDAGIEKLKTLANLQQIQLKGTKVTDAGIADFQAALPNCAVLR